MQLLWDLWMYLGCKALSRVVVLPKEVRGRKRPTSLPPQTRLLMLLGGWRLPCRRYGVVHGGCPSALGLGTGQPGFGTSAVQGRTRRSAIPRLCEALPPPPSPSEPPSKPTPSPAGTQRFPTIHFRTCANNCPQVATS